MTVASSAPDAPRITVRDEIDVRILIAALSLYSVHVKQEDLATVAEALLGDLLESPAGIGYSSRKTPSVSGGEIPERGRRSSFSQPRDGV